MGYVERLNGFHCQKWLKLTSGRAKWTIGRVDEEEKPGGRVEALASSKGFRLDPGVDAIQHFLGAGHGGGPVRVLGFVAQRQAHQLWEGSDGNACAYSGM